MMKHEKLILYLSFVLTIWVFTAASVPGQESVPDSAPPIQGPEHTLAHVGLDAGISNNNDMSSSDVIASIGTIVTMTLSVTMLALVIMAALFGFNVVVSYRKHSDAHEKIEKVLAQAQGVCDDLASTNKVHQDALEDRLSAALDEIDQKMNSVLGQIEQDAAFTINGIKDRRLRKEGVEEVRIEIDKSSPENIDLDLLYSGLSKLIDRPTPALFELYVDCMKCIDRRGEDAANCRKLCIEGLDKVHGIQGS